MSDKINYQNDRLTRTRGGRVLTVKVSDRKGVSLDLYVNGYYVGSTRKGLDDDAWDAAMRKLYTLVDRADAARKPELYDEFWFARPVMVDAA